MADDIEPVLSQIAQNHADGLIIQTGTGAVFAAGVHRGSSDRKSAANGSTRRRVYPGGSTAVIRAGGF